MFDLPCHEAVLVARFGMRACPHLQVCLEWRLSVQADWARIARHDADHHLHIPPAHDPMIYPAPIRPYIKN